MILIKNHKKLINTKTSDLKLSLLIVMKMKKKI